MGFAIAAAFIGLFLFAWWLLWWMSRPSTCPNCGGELVLLDGVALSEYDVCTRCKDVSPHG